MMSEGHCEELSLEKPVPSLDGLSPSPSRLSLPVTLSGPCSRSHSFDVATVLCIFLVERQLLME